MYIRGISRVLASKVLDRRASLLKKAASGKLEHNLVQTEHFLTNILGKQYVHKIDVENGETALTMAIQSAKDCLSKSNLKPEEIDMVVYISMHAEYFTPPTSIIVQKELNLSPTVRCLDLNANCVGMLMTYDMANDLMKGNDRYRNILVVNSECLRSLHHEEDIVPDACFSDSALSMVLSRNNEEQSSSGIIDSQPITLSYQSDFIVGPTVGYTRLVHNPNLKDALIHFKNVDCDMDKVVNVINEMLSKYGFRVDDIKRFYFSQFTKVNIDYLKSHLNLSDDKVTYIGEKIGYTGANSPFMAMSYDVDGGKVQTGDLCLFWTIGAGTQHMIILTRI